MPETTVVPTEMGPMITQLHIKAWINKCPLRAWRRDHGISQMTAAVQLDVSLPTVQTWEFGTCFPQDDNMAKIGALIGNEDVKDDWNKWFNKRPLVQAA